jgi:hypothetical protein
VFQVLRAVFADAEPGHHGQLHVGASQQVSRLSSPRRFRS